MNADPQPWLTLWTQKLQSIYLPCFCTQSEQGFQLFTSPGPVCIIPAKNNLEFTRQKEQVDPAQGASTINTGLEKGEGGHYT